ncbi:MAG: glycosyltransferase [Phycisphaerae bacterium]|nr:glycosyltransferase [Phycisphaerae bacterium]
MITGRNIICIASNWFYDPTSKHQVMKVLAERNHVLWVNYHGSRKVQASAADLRTAFKRLGEVLAGPQRVQPNITVLTPMVLPLPGSGLARRLNRRLLVRQIRRALRRLPDRPVQLWSFAPDVAYLAGQFHEECLLYYCVDEFSEFAGYDAPTIRSLEKELIDRSDLVVTTSTRLQETKAPLHERTVLVPHGVDREHFARATDPATAIPDDVADLPHPILGFFGLIQEWVDLELIAEVARRKPDWSIVMIGELRVQTLPVAETGNLHLLGRRPYESLPGYCKAFDVGLIPFRASELTRNVNPIKLREYLAAGLPVVSTPLPEVVAYEPLVEIADGADAFVAACRRALDANGPDQVARRQAAMARETWQAKVEQLSELVEGALGDESFLKKAFPPA